MNKVGSAAEEVNGRQHLGCCGCCLVLNAISIFSQTSYCISILLLSQVLSQCRPFSLTFLPIQFTVVKLYYFFSFMLIMNGYPSVRCGHTAVCIGPVCCLQFCFSIVVINGWQRQQEYFHSLPGIGSLAQMKDSERLGRAFS